MLADLGQTVRLTRCTNRRYIADMPTRQTTPGPYPNRLREMRQARGLTQQALADKSGVERPYIQKLESGRVWLSPEKIRPLADALGCGWWQLMPDAPDLDESDLRLVGALRKMGDDGHKKLMAWLEIATGAAVRDPQQ